jgi:D-beta-D-heptose 7-phosphate kinase/D-beta-D-heptose 1-phosphate adenosyltransferase
MKRKVLVTGGFDPLHSGHIDYFKAAKKLGDTLVVGVNSDEWLARKKGKHFMPYKERIAIIKELDVVDEVISFDDSDGSACQAIFKLLSTNGSDVEFVFANGGDRTNTNTPEYEIYHNYPNVEFYWGVGGTNKKNSSSWILDDWKTQKTERDWGYWRVLDDKPQDGYKVKELVINPGCSLSDQRHSKRSEHWYVLQGRVSIALDDGRTQNGICIDQHANGVVIAPGVWHRAFNDTDSPVHILETQYGEQCIEDDIERRNQ